MSFSPNKSISCHNEFVCTKTENDERKESNEKIMATNDTNRIPKKSEVRVLIGLYVISE